MDQESAYLRREVIRLAEMIAEIAGILGRGESELVHCMDRLEQIASAAMRTAERIEDGDGLP